MKNIIEVTDKDLIYLKTDTGEVKIYHVLTSLNCIRLVGVIRDSQYRKSLCVKFESPISHYREDLEKISFLLKQLNKNGKN